MEEGVIHKKMDIAGPRNWKKLAHNNSMEEGVIHKNLGIPGSLGAA